MAEAEVVKLQKHLALLREEYVKLQNKHTELERKYNLLNSIAGSNKIDVNSDSYITRLLKTIAELFDKDLYSDLTVKLNGRTLKAHRFVLDARSKNWASFDLSQINELDLSDLSFDIGFNLIRWVYTDIIENKKCDENFYLDMMKQASRFNLKELKEKCEDSLLAFVNVRNCIKFYEVAEEISANTLKAHCNELISNHWEDFTSDDFAYMPAALLFSMFKSKTTYPLHAAIKAKREDVVFLYLIENDSILKIKLNEIDDKNDLPLDLALRTKQESIAQNLVRNHADVNKADNEGFTLLHKAIMRYDEYSALFLIENNIKLNLQSSKEKKTALMSVASIMPGSISGELMEGMVNVGKRILMSSSVDVNIQDSLGNTCLHHAINADNKIIFKEILKLSKPNMNIRNNCDELPLWLALMKSETNNDFDEDSFASSIISKGCSINSVSNTQNGDTILHECARKKLEKSAVFLVNRDAEINTLNKQGESVMHIACENGLLELVKILLQKGANPNIQNTSSDINEFSVCKQTPMHKAILNGHENVLELFIIHKEREHKSSSIPNFNLKDSDGQSILSLCIWSNMLKIAKRLIDHGADVNISDNDGVPLLHQAILRQCTEGALFLLNQKVDLNIKSSDNLSALQLAVKRHLPLVVENLCKKGADMSILDSNGNSPLWNALDTGQEDIASILVANGCDTTQWSSGPGDCQQTLLHRAIDENNEAVAVFLIKSQCDINSPRMPGLNGETPEEALDAMTPLHLACTWGQEKVVLALVEHKCDLNKKDAEGNTPLHVAIINQHLGIIEILAKNPDVDLKMVNKSGKTPFAAALEIKNNKAASLVLNRDPKAAEQLDNKGRNFLHVAVINSDIETVLLLLSVNVNVNSRVQDNFGKTALHLSVETGSEMIVRNLLLAGVNVNDTTLNKKTALHLASELHHSSIGSIAQILLENGIDFDALDSGLNNALHISVQFNNLPVAQVLLKNSDIDAYAVNAKGMNPMHVLGQYGRENATAILEAFMSAIPNYELNRKDAKGNSCLLLAYQNGNGNLCRLLVKYGGALGVYNDEGVSIFNYPVATKQLLFKLLDTLSIEPPWVECETCLECKTKFTLTVRKHHCRHCGRVLCKKCSEKELAILKFGLQKPVRVCDLCYDVLTAGSGVQMILK